MTQNSRRYRAGGAPPDPATLRERVKLLEECIASHEGMIACLQKEIKVRRDWLKEDRRKLVRLRKEMGDDSGE